MTREQREQLDELAYKNATLHALLQLYDHRSPLLSEAEWYHHAVMVLTVYSDAALEQACELAKRLPPNTPIVIPKNKTGSIE